MSTSQIHRKDVKTILNENKMGALQKLILFFCFAIIALDGLDVVVESRRSGFEQLTVIRDKAALDALVAAAGDGAVSWSLPVKTCSQMPPLP